MHFDNRFVRELPADPSIDNHPRQVQGAAFSWVTPTPVSSPQWLGWSQPLADELGMSQSDACLQALAGNQTLPGMQSYAMAYGGHQFGQWAGQLGDGRAIALGELQTPSGQLRELQLKGAGPTPYSRTADGRAVLRSSLREFLCSEAMHALGVPTTRALSLVGTGEHVVRDMFYDGNAQPEPGAVVCRVAPSFLRFGNFQLPASRGDSNLLRQLVEFSIRQHAPEFVRGDKLDIPAWFSDICEKTATMIVHWMRVGFVHGVMNTDNMSIHGLTIDYGPYGWLEPFDPDWTPNTTDAQGRRYAFGRQPAIAHWNLAQLGNALATLLDDPQALSQGLERYVERFYLDYGQSFADKLGLSASAHDAPLLNDFMGCLGLVETDYCLAFRLLANVPLQQDPSGDGLQAWLDVLAPAFYSDEIAEPVRQAWQQWFGQYRQALLSDPLDKAQRQKGMNLANPLYVPRNYLAQQAIDAAALGDNSELKTLQDVLSKPYDEQPGREAYAARRPEWARHKAGCSALSCSS
ncbi:MAG: protein adenylyltransferase SelO [Oceanococcus sp.]